MRIITEPNATAGLFRIRFGYGTTGIERLLYRQSFLCAGRQILPRRESYNFQFNSETSRPVIEHRQCNRVRPRPAKLPNVGIFANSQAQFYHRTAYHAIGETAATGVNIGWLQENQSRLDVQSQLTTPDAQDYYSLTLQQGNNLKLAFNNVTNTAATRIQLLDPTGTEVIADNYGTPAQKQAFAALTSSNGIAASQGQYVVSVGYAPGANTSQTQTYNFQVYSGNTFNNSYQTTASAQTYQNAILSGNPAVVGYSALSTMANALTNLSNGGTTPSIFDTLSTIA